MHSKRLLMSFKHQTCKEGRDQGIPDLDILRMQIPVCKGLKYAEMFASVILIRQNTVWKVL